MLTRRQATNRNLDGVIDLERLRSGSSTSLERDAAGFAGWTRPTGNAASDRPIGRRTGHIGNAGHG